MKPLSLNSYYKARKGEHRMSKLNREALEKPFDDVKHRDGRGGTSLAYLEGWSVVQRLNEAFDGLYSFEIIRWEQVGNEVLVHGAISLRLDDGTVIRKDNIGAGEIQIKRDTGEMVSIGDAYKSAVTDCVKRCAAWGLGVGLYLYAGDENTQSATKPTHFNNTLSQAQKTAIFAIAKAKNLGPKAIDEIAVRNLGAPVNQLNKSQASQLIQTLQTMDARKAG
ncbi:Rad52/22 family double-strand break repair protein [compost metagenome]